MKNKKKGFGLFLRVGFICGLLGAVLCAGIPMRVQAKVVPYQLVFEPQYYAARYQDLQQLYGTDTVQLLRHFIRYGMQEGRQASDDFNVNIYKNRYQDLQRAFGSDLEAYYMHYMNYGYQEGRSGRLDGAMPKAITTTYQLPVPMNEDAVRAYYDEAVFVGDSLMVGFRNYETRHTDAYANQAEFLAVGSYSLIHALRPIEQDSLQPAFQGTKMNVWDAVTAIGAKRVFLLFGTNDIGLRGRSLEQVCQDYQGLIEQIRACNPEVEIHIISMTPVYQGVAFCNLSKDGVIAYNTMLMELAQEEDCGYLDIYSQLVGEDGYIQPQYCSDSYVHHSNAAYEQVWNQVLYNYAQGQN